MLARLLVTAVLLVVTVQPAQAADERTLTDLTLRVPPWEGVGQCFTTERGTISATVQLAQETTPTIRFGAGVPNGERENSISTLVIHQPVTYTVPVPSGLYCYSLLNEATFFRGP